MERNIGFLIIHSADSFHCYLFRVQQYLSKAQLLWSFNAIEQLLQERFLRRCPFTAEIVESMRTFVKKI